MLKIIKKIDRSTKLINLLFNYYNYYLKKNDSKRALLICQKSSQTS